MRFCNFFVDEMVAKVDGIGIILGIGVINFAHASPVESAQAHRARLATAINHATFKVEIVHRFARLANSIHFSVGSRVVVERNAIAACSHNFAIIHDYGPKRAASFINVVACQFASHFYKFHIFGCDFNFAVHHRFEI